MPSTYSTSLKLQLIGTGEQAGTWGTTTNYNLGTLLEQAITGVVTIPMGDATYTLTNYNGLTDEARNAVLILQGPITAPQYLAIPAGQQKVYIVRNRTGNTVTLTTGTGSNISVANAASEVLFTDGANVYSATQFNYINGDLTVTGSVNIGVDLNTAGNAVFLKNIYGNASTDQWYLPSGNTASRTASPVEGLIRYNTEGEFYEGYANSTWVRFIVANQGVYTINYVAIGGGGGARDIGSSGDWNSGGGGGGKVTTSTTPAIPGTTVLTITVGGGGAQGVQGSSSLITGIVDATGGGANPQNMFNGNGGVSGNGYAGGSPAGTGTAGGGGGGAGGVGGNGSKPFEPQWTGGDGGVGLEVTITGTSQTLAGGGGGGAYAQGGAGLNGGGNGNGGSYGAGSNGGVNTGGGAGGVYDVGGHAGGSGVVFLSMPTINYTGVFTGSPTVSTTGSNTVLKYTSSGTYTA